MSVGGVNYRSISQKYIGEAIFNRERLEDCRSSLPPWTSNLLRTDWAGRSANETQHKIADYANTADKNIRQLRAISGNQSGDPVGAAEAIVNAVESVNPPHRLLLGNDAYNGAIAKIDELREEFTTWEAASRGADFPKPAEAVSV